MGYNGSMLVKHYHSSSNRDLIGEFLLDCPKKIKSDYFDAVALLENGKTLQMPLNKPLYSVYPGLQELRFKEPSGIFRFLYFIKKKDAIYMVHAFKKKRQELADKEKKLVIKRIKEI